MEALPAPSRDSEAQLLAMLSKLWLIRRRDRAAALQIFGLPAFALSLCALVYEVFGRGLRHSTGYLELVVVPLFGVSAFGSSLATTLVAERSQGLLETMKIMSLSDGVYQIAHVFEALALGAVAAAEVAFLTVWLELCKQPQWGAVFHLFLAFYVAQTALALLVASTVEREQFAGQLMFFGQVVAAPLVFALAVVKMEDGHRDVKDHYVSPRVQRLACLHPTVALLVGLDAFRGPPTNERLRPPYRGLPEREIIRMLVIDALVYFVLARLVLALRSEYGSVAAFYGRAAALGRACFYGADDLALMEPLLASEHARPAPGALQDAKLTHGTPPSVVCRDLRKVYGGKAVVDDLSLDMYEGEIFSLLGHNGAGKSTTCGLLTGIVASDSKRDDGGAVVYGHGIRGGMTAVRQLAGFCPQHDCLFEKLSCYEHVVFFGRLKGRAQADAERAAADLLDRFRLGDRRSHLACELSGGMRRKLSTAIALCGGSKFALLDEPTAGMDALARRELWDLLAAVKRDRTVLLTTHYMDEADALGDRIGIMVSGVLRCCGTSQFLKQYYGAGYRVVCERDKGAAAPSLRKFDELLARKLGEGAKRLTEGAEAAHGDVIVATLPSTALPHFARFFDALESQKRKLEIASYGVAVSTLEDVFLKVDGQHARLDRDAARGASARALGSGRAYVPSPATQIYGLAKARLSVAKRSKADAFNALFPILGFLASFLCDKYEMFGKGDLNVANDFAAAYFISIAFMAYPAAIAARIIHERRVKLRSLLAVMGVDAPTYWVGNFVGDGALYGVVLAAMWAIMIGVAPQRWIRQGAMSYLLPVWGAFLIAYAYSLSFLFGTSPARAVVGIPGLNLLLTMLPQTIVLVAWVVAHKRFPKIFTKARVETGQFWLGAVTSPYTSFWIGFFQMGAGHFKKYVSKQTVYPTPRDIMVVLAVEGACHLLLVLYLDGRARLPVALPPHGNDLDPEEDDDVRAERQAVLATPDGPGEDEEAGAAPALVVKHLRKVFPAAKPGDADVVAVRNNCFQVRRGECFGLLGANGAGKSTTLNMIIRHTVPSAGDARIMGHSVLDDFDAAAKHLGVVDQHNTLWDSLSAQDHLELFAMLRGCPRGEARALVDACLEDLELKPHAAKLSRDLSGGMKRKLCCAIALIGDPACVLLDEPSAGLDPVARRNLWNVLGATMSARGVVLTSHLMDEVTVLCDRISIMTKGTMRCLGTPQHLVDAYGRHYELTVVHTLDADPAKLDEFVHASFAKRSALDSVMQNRRTYLIDRDAVDVASAFRSLEKRKKALGVDEYMFNQPSLEQVFLKFAASARDDFLEAEPVTAKPHGNFGEDAGDAEAPPALTRGTSFSHKRGR